MTDLATRPDRIALVRRDFAAIFENTGVAVYAIAWNTRVAAGAPKSVEAVSPIRDEIKTPIEGLFAQLLPDGLNIRRHLGAGPP